MHQFRDKSMAQRYCELVSAGLLIYPVLQAADVLAYRAHEVPVGDDQRQHLELTRDVAQALQRALRRDLRRARARDPGGRRADHGPAGPDRKMSTTGGSEQGTVYVLDEPAAIEKKFKSAVTDSGSEIRHGPDKPGISNLIEILAVARGASPEALEPSSTAPATATSSRRRRALWSPTWRPCASATTRCAPTSRRSRRRSRRRREGARGSRRRRCATCASAMGVGPVGTGPIAAACRP